MEEEVDVEAEQPVKSFRPGERSAHLWLGYLFPAFHFYGALNYM